LLHGNSLRHLSLPLKGLDEEPRRFGAPRLRWIDGLEMRPASVSLAQPNSLAVADMQPGTIRSGGSFGARGYGRDLPRNQLLLRPLKHVSVAPSR
jgi:hypothetical protein